MKKLILQGSLYKDEKFVEYFSKLKFSTNQDIIKSLNLKSACTNAIEKLFENQDFVKSLFTVSQSIFLNRYNKLLVQAVFQNIINEAKDGKKYFITKRGDDISVTDENSDTVEDLKVLNRIANRLNRDIDELKPAHDKNKASKEVKNLSKESFEDEYEVFINTVSDLSNDKISGKNISEENYKKIIDTIDFERLQRRAIKKEISGKDIKNLPEDAAKILACAIVTKIRSSNGVATSKKVKYKKVFNGFSPYNDIILKGFTKKGHFGLDLADDLKIKKQNGKDFPISISKGTTFNSDDKFNLLANCLEQGINGKPLPDPQSYVDALNVIKKTVEPALGWAHHSDEQKSNIRTVIEKCDQIIKGIIQIYGNVTSPDESKKVVTTGNSADKLKADESKKAVTTGNSADKLKADESKKA